MTCGEVARVEMCPTRHESKREDFEGVSGLRDAKFTVTDRIGTQSRVHRCPLVVRSRDDVKTFDFSTPSNDRSYTWDLILAHKFTVVLFSACSFPCLMS
jgi:hypothetical protein